MNFLGENRRILGRAGSPQWAYEIRDAESDAPYQKPISKRRRAMLAAALH
jgi:hypothetical protein